MALNYNATLGNRMHNEFRIGITRFPSSRANEHTEDLTTQFGFTGAVAQLHPELLDPEFLVGSPTFFFESAGYPGVGGAGVNTTKLNTFYVADNFLLDVGKHSLKFGGEYRAWSSDRLQGSAMGNMSFGRRGGQGGFTTQFPTAASWNNTGNSVADTLLGWTRRTGNGLPTGEDFTAPYWGVYFQDDWRVTSRLTINMGIRWELYMQPRPNNLDPTQNLGKPIFEGFPIDDTSDIIPLFRFKEWILPTGTGDCGCIMDKKNFAPRFGIAYRLTNNTVIRTGIGHYYSENGVAQLESTRWRGGGEGGGGPAATGLGTVSNFTTTEVMLSDGFPSFQLGVADLTTYTAGGVQRAPDFKPTISSTQWFLDIQHQLPGDILLTLGYNGQAQSHMPWWLRNAAAPLGPGLTSQFARRRTPSAADSNTVRRLNGISFNDNITNANYNAFTAKIEKRFSDGFSFTNSFTWSKLLDIGIGSINERGEGIVGGGQPQSPHVNNHHLNYGLSGLSRKFANATSILYELPAGPGKGRFQSGPASWILGGWQLGTILTFQSGPWMSTMLSPNIQQSGGTYRGDLVGEMNLPRGQRDSTLWWNRFAVAPSAPGTYGNIGRGMLELAGFKNFDFVLSKNFPMPFEGHRMQFRFEAFNFTNTPHLGPPDSFPGNPNSRADARLASSVRIVRADQPRIIQFALKYVF